MPARLVVNAVKIGQYCGISKPLNSATLILGPCRNSLFLCQVDNIWQLSHIEEAEHPSFFAGERGMLPRLVGRL